VSVSTVFVDRDGVLNRKPPPHRYLGSASSLVLLPGAAEAVAALNAAGIRVYVVSNQRGIALGRLTPAVLTEIHAALADKLSMAGAHLDGIYVCPHQNGTCDCRKPAPGLLLQARRDHPDIDFSRSVLVGDSATDIQAGQAVGCRTVLIGRGQRRAAELERLAQHPPTWTAASLLDATRKYLVPEARRRTSMT